ncbi:MAG: response regulator [Myxococcales bacterium]|nr:response regulator [Myxococcales bacterium]
MSALLELSPRILVVDDNAAIHEDFRKVLCPPERDDELAQLEQELLGEPHAPRRPSFELDSAMQGRDGLAHVERAVAVGAPYALAFVDMRMPPGWDGIETIERLWRVDPALHVVICSAYSDYSWDDINARLGTTDALLILKKPFDNAELIQIAYALTQKWKLHQTQRRHAEQLEQLVNKRTTLLEQTTHRLESEIAQRKQAEADLQLANKLEAIGQLAAGIAHEINTPTQYVSDNINFLSRGYESCARVHTKMREALERQAESPTGAALLQEVALFERQLRIERLQARIPRAFEAVREGLDRITSIVQAMKEFGHPDNGNKTEVDLNQLLRTTLEVSRNEYKYVADVELELGDLPPVSCLRSEMSQVFLNLIVNAAHAIEDVVSGTEERGTITVRSGVEGDDVVVTVGDTGAGIPDAIRQRVFDPFFTTKEVGKGTGQGLAIARSVVVDKHGGKLSLAPSRAGGGTVFSVSIPFKHCINDQDHSNGVIV